MQERSSIVLPVAIAAAAIVALGVVGIVAIAVSGGGDGGATATPTVVNETALTIRITDFEFDPPNASVPLGAAVTWLNEDEARHDSVADNDVWDTGDLDEGESAVFVMDEPGTFEYKCTIHPYMTGVLTVRAD